MIQITKEMRKQLDHQARIDRCLSYLQIVTQPSMTPSGYATFAAVSSTSHGGRYIVDIDEDTKIPHATRCSCPATKRCVHMDAVDQYYQNIAALFAHTEEEEPEVVEQPTTIAEPTPDEIAAAAEEVNMQKLAEYRRSVAENAYEELGATKHVHCGGCHQICGEGKGDRCKPGFCFWNSWWTEAQRAA